MNIFGNIKKYNEKYDLHNNQEFLIWINNIIKNGYDVFINIEQMQDLIDKIVYWYQIKYPENEINWIYQTKYFENVNKLTKNMSVRQLLNRISDSQLKLLTCPYRAGEYKIKYQFNEKKTDVESKIIINLNVKELNKKAKRNNNNGFSISVDALTGQVYNNDDLKRYVDFDINIDDLYFLFFEKYNNFLDFSKLEDCVYNHNCDIEIRKNLLETVISKLLYSSNNSELGFLRMIKFIDEFNKELNLNIKPDDVLKIFDKEKTKCKKLTK